VTYEDDRDAVDAVRDMHDRDFLGRRCKCELAKEPRDARDRLTDEHRDRRGRPEARVLVTGLPSDATWQDLKDLGRGVGNVLFADVTTNAQHGTFGVSVRAACARTRALQRAVRTRAPSCRAAHRVRSMAYLLAAAAPRPRARPSRPRRSSSSRRRTSRRRP